MDVALARTFLAVKDAGSFVTAAARLNITQSTVSARVQRLEELIGLALFARSKAGATLTPAGRQFEKHALALVRVWEHARLDVALAEEHDDVLTVGGQFSLWDGFLLRWLAWLQTAHPRLAVTAVPGFSNQMMDRLIDGTLDLAVMYRPEQRPGLAVDHLFDEELVLVTSGDAGTEKPGDNYIFVNWGPEFQADHALAFPNLRQPGLYFDLGSLGVNYLLDKTASGYFPARVAAPYLKTGQLSIIERAPRFLYPAFAVYPEDHDAATFGPVLAGLKRAASEIL